MEPASGGQYGEIDTKGLAVALAMMFATEKINNDSSLLPNMTIGYDIRDYCENVTTATRITYELLAGKSCADTPQRKRRRKSIVALIGPEESSTAMVIAGCLQTFNLSGISGTATSPELSSYPYKHLYRTKPPDTYRAKAFADIIEYFNWTYVAAVGVDDSYGRQGVWRLLNKSQARDSSFCIAITQFIPYETSSQSIRDIVTKLSGYENISYYPVDIRQLSKIFL